MGLNPYELSEKIFSHIDSSTRARAFCTIFSLGLPTPRGLSSFLPGFGIITLRAGLNLNFPFRRFIAVFSNHFSLIPSRVVLSVPLDIFPGLLLIARLQACRNSTFAIMLIRPLYVPSPLKYLPTSVFSHELTDTFDRLSFSGLRLSVSLMLES